MGIIHPAFKALVKYRELVLNVVGDFQGCLFAHAGCCYCKMHEMFGLFNLKQKLDALRIMLYISESLAYRNGTNGSLLWGTEHCKCLDIASEKHIYSG